MFQSKDKKKTFGSKFVTDRYDREHESDAPETEEQKPQDKKPSTADEPENKEDNEPQSAHEVVERHGKAHSVHVHHDHKNNKHKVVSHHEDGHMHESEHGSAGEAHKHASELGSADEQDLAPTENQGAMSSAEPSSGIPGLE